MELVADSLQFLPESSPRRASPSSHEMQPWDQAPEERARRFGLAERGTDREANRSLRTGRGRRGIFLALLAPPGQRSSRRWTRGRIQRATLQNEVWGAFTAGLLGECKSFARGPRSRGARNTVNRCFQSGCGLAARWMPNAVNHPTPVIMRRMRRYRRAAHHPL